MKALRDTLIAWIDERVQNMLATPRAWGSDEAIEMQILLLLEVRALVLNPERELETPGRIVDVYTAHVAEAHPTKPHRPLSQIAEPDHLGHNLASELRRVVEVLARTAMEESAPLSDESSGFVGYDEFNAACNGDIGALRNLAVRYPYATFVLIIDGKEVRCRNLRFDAMGMQYRFAETYGHNVPRVHIHRVERLVRLESSPASSVFQSATLSSRLFQRAA